VVETRATEGRHIVLTVTTSSQHQGRVLTRRL